MTTSHTSEVCKNSSNRRTIIRSTETEIFCSRIRKQLFSATCAQFLKFQQYFRRNLFKKNSNRELDHRKYVSAFCSLQFGEFITKTTRRVFFFRCIPKRKISVQVKE